MRPRAAQVVLVLAGLVLSAPAAAQDAPEIPEWTLQVDPLTTALGFVHLQVERRLSDSFSVYAGPHLHLFDGLLDQESGDSYRGYGAEAGLRWFFLGGAPQGFWAQVRGVVAHITPSTDVSGVGGYVSALAGYTAIFDGWFVLAGGLGLQYMHYHVDGIGPKGILPAAHTTIGVAF